MERGRKSPEIGEGGNCSVFVTENTCMMMFVWFLFFFFLSDVAIMETKKILVLKIRERVKFF